MPKLIIDQKEYELNENTPIAETCENHGIPFSCNSGVCGTCQIEIIEGADNLSELNKEELDLAMDKNHRLSCQCQLIRGTVRVTF